MFCLKKFYGMMYRKEILWDTLLMCILNNEEENCDSYY
jgi:hypothetical protein